VPMYPRGLSTNEIRGTDYTTVRPHKLRRHARLPRCSTGLGGAALGAAGGAIAGNAGLGALIGGATGAVFGGATSPRGAYAGPSPLCY
jgi:hypothetical protein